MNKYIEALTLESGTVKNKKSYTHKKLSGESFESIFSKAVIDEDVKKTENNSETSEKTNTSGIFDTEKLHQYYENQLEYEEDMAVERLGAFFGIGKELMKAILQYLHINPKDLLDPSKRDLIVKALIKKFGLCKDKAEALSELMKGF